jgi:hypothetical protein
MSFKPKSFLEPALQDTSFQMLSLEDMKARLKDLASEHYSNSQSETECVKTQRMMIEIDQLTSKQRVLQFVRNEILAHEKLKVIR